MHIKLIGMKHRTPCKQIFCPFTHPRPCMGSKLKRSKHFFSEEGYVAYQIMQLKCLTLCTPLIFWVTVKRSDLE